MNLITRHATSDEPGKRLLRPVGWAAFNTARIEAGRAFFGIDFDENFVPAETGSLLSRAVSFTKGCYPGQEIVARMHARGQVAKQIAGFRMDSDALPIAGAQVLDDQSNVIGAVTSSTISPVLSNAAIGLAILKRPHFEARKLIHIPAEGAIHNAKVVELPFLRG
jgi:folate-binding protein YgfZ